MGSYCLHGYQHRDLDHMKTFYKQNNDSILEKMERICVSIKAQLGTVKLQLWWGPGKVRHTAGLCLYDIVFCFIYNPNRLSTHTRLILQVFIFPTRSMKSQQFCPLSFHLTLLRKKMPMWQLQRWCVCNTVMWQVQLGVHCAICLLKLMHIKLNFCITNTKITYYTIITS
jgi:hypothetical protein